MTLDFEGFACRVLTQGESANGWLCFLRLRPGMWLDDYGVFGAIRGARDHMDVGKTSLIQGKETKLFSGDYLEVFTSMRRSSAGLLAKWDRNRYDKVIWPFCDGFHWSLLVFNLKDSIATLNCSLGMYVLAQVNDGFLCV